MSTLLNKQVLKTALVILCIVGALTKFVYFMDKHTQHYTMRGTCEEKITTQNREGTAIYYKILVRYENGEVKELSVDARDYVTYTKGKPYIFNRSKFVW